MDDLDDLEAQMATADRAQARVDEHGGIPHGPHRNVGKPSRVTPEVYADMARTAWLQQNNPEAVPVWLKDLEDQCIDLLHPDDRDYFRSRQ